MTVTAPAWEVQTPYGTIACATRPEAVAKAREAAAITKRACAVRKVAAPAVPTCPREGCDYPAGGPSHDNCIRPGRMGHSPAHCTANACW